MARRSSAVFRAKTMVGWCGGGEMGCLSAPRGGDVGGRSHGRIHVVPLSDAVRVRLVDTVPAMLREKCLAVLVLLSRVRIPRAITVYVADAVAACSVLFGSILVSRVESSSSC